MAWITIEQEGRKYQVRHIRHWNPKKTTLSYEDWCKREERRRRRRLKRLRRKERKRGVPKPPKKPSKPKKFKRPAYTDYINSPEWKARRDRYLQEHNNRCEACGNRHNLTVHHTHYGYLGREKDEHLAALCWFCHEAFHKQYGTKTVLQEETAEFIVNVKIGAIRF